jgi:hypothetical protein
MIDDAGNRVILIEGLPSGPAPPNNDQSGVSGLALRNRTLFFSIGAGNATVAGPAPGSELPNSGRSSPIFSSVLGLELDDPLTASSGGFLIQPADHTKLANREPILLTNPLGQTATLRLVVDIPDYEPSPRPDVPGNVRVSNPFGLEIDESCTFWLVDAARNLLWRVNWCENILEPAVVFPPVANPLPTGPRLLDAVPTSVRAHEGDLLVSFLTGAPFVPGLAEVKRVKTGSGESEVFLRGHRMLVDVLFSDRRPDGFLVLEFSQNPAAGLPGRLLYYDSRAAAPQVLSDRVTSPTHMALSPYADEVWITEIFQGRIVAVELPK